MRKIGLTLTVFSLILFSCQKEIDWGGGQPVMLVKVLSKSTSSSDSTLIEYSYDGNQRLIREKTSGIGNGVDLGNDLTIYRNSSGVITKTVQKSALFQMAGIDSVVTRYDYSGSTNRYTAAVFGITLFGFTVYDSTSFSYDASNRIYEDKHYQSLLGLPYELGLKNEYTYSASGGNVTSVKQFSYDATTGLFDPVSELNYMFDAKTSPLRLNFKSEGIVLTRVGLFNANNPLQDAYIDPNDATNNLTNDYVITYNSAGKPATAISTQTPGGTVNNITYFYQ